MEWLKHFSLAINYLENNLTGEISYEKAAQIACCSTFYFQRMFSYIAGISLSEYIRRRRMTQAAFELQQSTAKVSEIALTYGYPSLTSFNRAFQSVHGVAPTTARFEGTALCSYPRIRLTIHVTGGENMQYRIETKDPIRIVGIRTTLSEDQAQNFNTVPRFWENSFKNALVTKIGQLSNQDPSGILGVTVYEKPEKIDYYIAAASDHTVPEKMTEVVIPDATWAIFESNGPFRESVQSIFKRFLTEWLPFSGYEYAGLPDLEIYPRDGHPPTGHSQVWIAVIKTPNSTYGG